MLGVKHNTYSLFISLCLPIEFVCACVCARALIERIIFLRFHVYTLHKSLVLEWDFPPLFRLVTEYMCMCVDACKLVYYVLCTSMSTFGPLASLGSLAGQNLLLFSGLVCARSGVFTESCGRFGLNCSFHSDLGTSPFFRTSGLDCHDEVKDKE